MLGDPLEAWAREMVEVGVEEEERGCPVWLSGRVCGLRVVHPEY